MKQSPADFASCIAATTHAHGSSGRCPSLLYIEGPRPAEGRIAESDLVARSSSRSLRAPRDAGYGRTVTNYQLGVDFPREGFVQRAIEDHFSSGSTQKLGFADLACTDSSGRRWLIEAKGETSDVGLDFRTGLGQLVQGVPSADWTVALAMPDTPKFALQRSRTSEWARRALGLHWLIVAEDGTVTIVPPDAS
jgi:hypothetical protein